MRVIAGGRYSSEKKEGTRTLTFVNGVTGAPVVSPINQTIIALSLRAEQQDLSDSRNETNFAPQLAVQYDIAPDIMAYVSATRGYKSGGYDARSNAVPNSTLVPGSGSFEYKPEKATGFEIGTKAVVADGAAEINLAAFRTEYEDLQISTFDGVLGFNVGNAAEAVSQGVELDSRWLVTRGLILSASIAYLDFQYKKYPNGQPTQAERLANPNNLYTDYEGKTNQYVAKSNGNFGADYTYTLTDNLDLRSSIDFIFTSSYNPSQNLDPAVDQPGYAKINARVALVGNGDQWELALVGKNLTDKQTVCRMRMMRRWHPNSSALLPTTALLKSLVPLQCRAYTASEGLCHPFRKVFQKTAPPAR